jgi:hypothetical protein
VQLRFPQQLRAVVAAALVAVAGLAVAPSARAQAFTFDTTHTLYTESPTRTHMTVYTPGASLEVAPWEFLTVRGGYEADVVTGASVATKAGAAYAGTHPSADVVSTASVHDVRSSANGGFTWTHGNSAVTGGYSYSTEHDYKSNSFDVAARTDAFDHNSQFEISYARNFDRVCDRVQGTQDDVTRYVALESSTGCFSSDSTRTTRDLDIDGYQASWTQAWTPIFATQVTYTGQIINGFQSNPYRSIILGEGVKAQEHEPDNRFRQSYSARANIFLRSFKGALHIGGRGYFDTWGVTSGTGEAELEKYLGEHARVALRGRFYKQTGASFWSDDYTGGNAPLGPKGQFWTGDRELSPMWSFLVGARAGYTFMPANDGRAGTRRIAHVFTALKLSASADILHFNYDEYTLGGVAISNANAYIFSLGFTALF